MLVPADEVIFHPWRINEVQIMKGPGMIFRISKKGDTVDGTSWYVNIPLLIGFYTSQLVQDFFH